MLIADSDTPRYRPLEDQIEREIRGFFPADELELLPMMAGDGSPAGVRRVLDRALADTSVAVVICLGPIASHLLAQGGPPPRPAIAAAIIDPAWQGLASREGASGVRGLTYTSYSYPIQNTLADFRALFPFRRLAVLLDRSLLAAVPPLAAGAADLVRAVGAEAVMVPVDSTADAALAALPPGTDAVYVTPFPAMSDSELDRLVAGLRDRRLPSLSYTAAPEVPRGILASYEPAEDGLRRARRVAVSLQRILAGEEAGALPVDIVSAPRLTLNIATARALGFTPGWSVLTDAEIVGEGPAGPADTLSLGDAVRQAVIANLDLAVAGVDVLSGRQSVRLARANLLPQITSQLRGTLTREETAEASLGQQPERLLDGSLSLSLPLYTESAWAGYGSQRRLQEARVAQRDQVRLDVALEAATGYLNVLRARSLADVQRSYLARTRSNLEIARLRESVGAASRADVYRWQGEVANARSEVISADAQVRVAELEYRRVLNRPLERPLAARTTGLDDPALLVGDPAILAWLDDPTRFAWLGDFLVNEALRISPELAQVDATIGAQRRQRTASTRAFWLPSFTLNGGLTNIFSRGGAGSDPPALPPPLAGAFDPPDLSWQMRLQASLPLFTGFSRTATRSQAGLELDRLTHQRSAVVQGVTQRVRARLEIAAASHAAITLTREAAEAAGRNLELVTDAYASGAVSITSLIDAQNAARTSAEAAANAVHDFLLDLMQVERAMGAFGALLSQEERAVFTERLITLAREKAQ